MRKIVIAAVMLFMLLLATECLADDLKKDSPLESKSLRASADQIVSDLIKQKAYGRNAFPQPQPPVKTSWKKPAIAIGAIVAVVVIIKVISRPHDGPAVPGGSGTGGSGSGPGGDNQAVVLPLD